MTSDLGRVTTLHAEGNLPILNIVVTSDLGRVTTYWEKYELELDNCGDVRSRTSYNQSLKKKRSQRPIVVTSDLGRVTTPDISSTDLLKKLW